MRKRFVGMFKCVQCGHPKLSLDIIEAENDSVVKNGLLRCGACGTVYPIIDYVPILLKPDAIWSLMTDYERNFCLGKNLLCSVTANPVQPDYLGEKTDIANKWDYQWREVYEATKRGDIKGHWAEPGYMSDRPWFVLQPDDYAGKKIIRLGASNGNPTPFRWNKEKVETADCIVNIDISDGLRLTEVNGHHLQNSVFVKADITALPFEQGLFDYVTSFGVLHHLPNVYGGLSIAHGCLKKGGSLRVMIYGYTFFMANIIEPLKKHFIFKFGDKGIYRISYLMTLFLFPLVKGVHALRKLRIVKWIPFHEHWISWGEGTFTFLFWAIYDLIHARLAHYSKPQDIRNFMACLEHTALRVESHRQANITIRLDR